MTIKIGVNARTFSVNEPGGAVQAAIKLTRALSQQDDIEIILFGHSSLTGLIDNAKVVSRGYIKPSQGYGLLWERTLLPYLARKNDIDLLFCPNGNGPVTDQPFPVVVCIHDINAQLGWSSNIHQAYRKATIPRVITASDHIITVSQFSKEEIKDNLNVEDKCISVVHNGIDSFYFDNGNQEYIDLPNKYILFVGAMNPRKNIIGLVKSFKKLDEKEDFSHSLVLIGPQNKTIFKKANVDPSANIYMPGFVSQPQLKYAYQNASLFSYPSFYEGFALPPLEALACGTPVTASKCGVLPEIDSKAIKFVDPNDIEDITQGMEVQLRTTYSKEETQCVAQRFSWERAASDLRNVFDRILYCQ